MANKVGESKTLEGTGAFARLQPYCVQLLALLQNPRKSADFLPDMALILRQSPPEALQPSLDYTLFPFLLLLDAAVQCRKENKADSNGIFVSNDAAFAGYEVSDSVAEGMLPCLEELLKKCYLDSVNQMVMVLKKLTSGAMLSPSEASEEFRVGIIRCFRALLQRLQPCSATSCSCKRRISLPTTESIISAHGDKDALSRRQADSQECLLAFLQSQNASPAVGHWLSLLLQAAEVEASMGHKGSATLRKEAFFSLRVLVAKVGSADALAFFLPGIVSRFAKALYAFKSTMSGAAGSSGSIEQAIRGLTEFLMVVLDDDANCDGLKMSTNSLASYHPMQSESSQVILEALRRLPATQRQSDLVGCTIDEAVPVASPGHGFTENNIVRDDKNRSFYVHRSKQWIDETSVNVDKLLSATFPHLCVHPSEKLRKALVDGVRGLLLYCRRTLERSKLMLLECLSVLVCDDSVVVSIAAQDSLEYLFGMGEKFLNQKELTDIFTTMVEKLPRVVLGSDEMTALSHAQRLLALMYYAGPDIAVDYLFQSPIGVARFLDSFTVSLSQNSQFSGSVNKLILSKLLAPSYLLSISELKNGKLLNSGCTANSAAFDVIPKISFLHEKDLEKSSDKDIAFEFPHMPPWFAHVGCQKLYLTLSGALRLACLSIISGHKNDVSLLVPVDILLDSLRKLISELRMRDYSKEGWQSWYFKNGLGQLFRKASASVCVLNEMIYGLSDQSVSMLSELFRKSSSNKLHDMVGDHYVFDKDQYPELKCDRSSWKDRTGKNSMEHVIQIVGTILHEYTSTEVWDLPVDENSYKLDSEMGPDLPPHLCRDITVLQQVILDGIGIFAIVLGKDFVGSGFLHSSLYLILQNLICSNSQIRTAADSVLRVLSISSGYATVGQLVVASADYIIDSLCRQLRHLELNSRVPYVLAAMLSYVGAAHDILPLLEEPMRSVSQELEVLGRHQHPHLTIPFLKAVSEITKASRCEACLLPNLAQSFASDVTDKSHSIRKMFNNNEAAYGMDLSLSTSERTGSKVSDVSLDIQYWEELLCKLNEMKTYRRIIGSLVASCLQVAVPLLSSQKESACLVALDIIEDVSVSLAKVEAAYKYEKQGKAAIEEAIRLLCYNDLQDDMDTVDDADENRLLPAMNKIWPYLILCFKNKISVAVIRRCTDVLSKAIEIAGGDFFVRRFQTDAQIIWKLLTSSPFRRRNIDSNSDQRILLPYRGSSVEEQPMAEISNQKIQAAILDMITRLSLKRKGTSALETVLKKVCGIVVGIAYGNSSSLRQACIGALTGLASVDSDLVWLLLADVFFSIKKDRSPPPMSDLASISEILPVPSSSKEYLYVQYAGEGLGWDIDPSSVEAVFSIMQSKVLN